VAVVRAIRRYQRVSRDAEQRARLHLRPSR
jgi:hypothetical protein